MLPCVHSVALNVMTAQAVEQMGADSLWVPDHLLGFWHPDIWKDFPAASAMPDPDAFLDPFCVATAVAGSTSLPIGTCVTDASRRGGIDLVRGALTVNEIATGGFTLGVGSGERESTVPFGYDFTKPVGNLERTLGEIPARHRRHAGRGCRPNRHRPGRTQRCARGLGWRAGRTPLAASGW